jgi:hypothetical protein
MQQVKTFPIKQEAACNEFLATIKPANMTAKDGLIVTFYDDGTYPDPYTIVDLYEHLDSVRKAKFQQEVALHVAKSELADLNPLKNKGRFEEVDQAIRNIEDAIDIQMVKEDFLLGRIEELKKLQ